LPFSETSCFGAVGVHAPEPLAVGIKYRHQKVTMLPPLIGVEVRYFSFILRSWLRRGRRCFFCFFHSHSLFGHVPDFNDYDNRCSASQLIFTRKCILLRRNQLPPKKTIVLLLTLCALLMCPDTPPFQFQSRHRPNCHVPSRKFHKRNRSVRPTLFDSGRLIL
jgi:hypothetical protein